MPLSKEYIESLGYLHVQQLPNGNWIGITPLLFTFGVCYPIHERGYERRWCYELLDEALIAIKEWDGNGEMPGPWVAKR